MKNITYLIVLGAIMLFSACRDITVGYLETEKAKYTIDTLHILSDINGKLQELENIENEFYQNTQDLQDEIVRAKETYDSDEFWEAWDNSDEIFEIEMDYASGEIDDDEYMRRMEEAENRILMEEFGISAPIDTLQKHLENLAVEMGIGSLDILLKQISVYQQKIDYNLPWVSAAIEGVLGTQPLLYTVIGVKCDNQNAADTFMKHVGIMGDGAIYVDLDAVLSPGNYTVSIQLENEGRSRILPDVFTFVVDAATDESE